jgi:hypothetical protein
VTTPGRPPPSAPLWRQAFDAAERAIAPRAEDLVRSEYFSLATALLRRAQTVAGGSVQGLSARAWHLLNLPAGSDISRLRAQIGSLDREVRRLTIQLEQERRRGPASLPGSSRSTTDPSTEDSDADGAQPADGARPRPARRRAQRPARP